MKTMLLVLFSALLLTAVLFGCSSAKFYTKCEQVGKGVWKNCEDVEQ